MKQYRENNKEKIYELTQQSYNCPYCDRKNLHVYYKKHNEKTKYCMKRRQVSPTESSLRLMSESGNPVNTVQIIKQITD